MNYSVLVRRSAENDIAEARDWYEMQRAGLGGEFLARLGAAVDRLRSLPYSYPVVHHDVRRAVLDRFPYLVYFRIDGEHVRVIACLHGRRDPRLHRQRTNR